MDRILEEVKVDYEKSLRAGTVDMMVLKPPEASKKEETEEEANNADYENVPPAPTMWVPFTTIPFPFSIYYHIR